MLSAEQLAGRRAVIAGSADLRRLQATLARRATPLLERLPEIPSSKALLTVDGGVCPRDGAALEFDPWSPRRHRCPVCRTNVAGERHDRAWARWQHLWLAERTADLAALAALEGSGDAADRAAALLSAYGERYTDYPNRDNVLGPARLFFSTYLESIWLTGVLAAASLLREAGMLDEQVAEAVSRVADEGAGLIGEFDEGFSNRQTWHNAALAAIAVWFEDEELATRAVEGPTGIIAHLIRGFGTDGMWYEGENYHLFALRGQLLAMGWAEQAGVSLTADPRLAARLAAALRAPALTALPDLTFPARKDSRYGVSLAQPMYLELWEVGLARLGEQGAGIAGWLAELYSAAPPPAQRFDSYLHETGEAAPTGARTRGDLSWWALLEMLPELPPAAEPWRPGSVLLERQGLGILRGEDRYASLECGGYGGGHGHPDRLHLTLHAGGVHWLPDPGAGAYVTRDLFWYRSTLAHNAPRLDGRSQVAGDATCAAFDVSGAWGWIEGEFPPFVRTVVAGPGYLADVVEFSAAESHDVELPWHPSGRIEMLTPGTWVPETLQEEFVERGERFVPASVGSLHLRATEGDRTLNLHLLFEGELLRAAGPGVPGAGPAEFLLARGTGRGVRFFAVLEPGPEARVRGLRASGDVLEIERDGQTDRHVRTDEGWEVTTAGGTVALRGRRRPEVDVARPLIDPHRPLPVRGVALHLYEPPALDGTADGFGEAEPLALDHEDQYRRSEEPYPGPEEFSALALVGWGEGELYVAVAVTTPVPSFRAADAPALLLDNEPDDIHSDGVQLYVRTSAAGPVYG
ncbi:MAG TPA: heparinase II/III family protein, partial [Gemmatimonadales bacterium]